MQKKKFSYFLLTAILLAICSVRSSAQIKVEFPSRDSLAITADWYPVDTTMPVILLCHQSGSSRGEYRETALRLNKSGFNCMAVDLRSGESVNGIDNETAARAKKLNKGQSFLDAEQDILSAIDYLHKKYKKRIILTGSSYSASLALIIAKENNFVLGVAAFSPGEYLGKNDFVAKHVDGLNKPVFLTSSLSEAVDVMELAKDIVSRIKIQYIPKTPGSHGSKVLWDSQPESEEYWIAFMGFLNKMKNIS